MIKNIYLLLLKAYGKQGWWPVIRNGEMVYHPNDYVTPSSEKEKFHVVVGAILTQNTSWKQAEKALLNLYHASLLSPQEILKAKKAEISRLIKPTGYYNQKATYLKEIAKWFLAGEKTRDALLKVKGVGEETADSILLYAFHQPTFVIDAYTRRIFHRLGLYQNDRELRQLVESKLRREEELNEFHALLVEHAKRVCRKLPKCEECPLRKKCIFAIHKMGHERKPSFKRISLNKNESEVER